MPRRDGTGPIGFRSGKGLGLCSGLNTIKCEDKLVRGCRQYNRRNFLVNSTVNKTEKELLAEQKSLLENRLELLNKQLESL